MSIYENIEAKIKKSYEFEQFTLVNESDRHNVPDHSETHFKLTLVSPQFENMTKVSRHREVYALLSEELNSTVHALALHLYTPEEWQQLPQVKDSPECQHK